MLIEYHIHYLCIHYTRVLEHGAERVVAVGIAIGVVKVERSCIGAIVVVTTAIEPRVTRIRFYSLIPIFQRVDEIPCFRLIIIKFILKI